MKWSDEFNTLALDQSKWVLEQGGGGWGNNELQNYTSSPDNAFINSSGNLVIKAIKQQLGSNAYTSARLITKGKQNFQYGRIDVRAKIPKGKGVWPAIWMLGADIDQNNWPKCGEIDIMELRGSRPMELISTMHYANSTGAYEYIGTTEKLTVDLSADFHTYSVVRSKNMTRFYLDGSAEPYYTFTGTSANPFPFNNPFFLILNVAVGATSTATRTARLPSPSKWKSITFAISSTSKKSQRRGQPLGVGNEPGMTRLPGNFPLARVGVVLSCGFLSAATPGNRNAYAIQPFAG
ncbi:glycoside hydrolase family 16 protein [Hymenobacter sp. 5516J-16]|uniref:glycoside hydrolase family 16 protein n=1 Tax=Hymenobacter sp. 5516J-16 TaxID=2932253 RepID=UPI001FD32FFA|nr:glycoside hydrolase family 16 protein [Hymenobacter sp. 5516J-16]UOQ75375.1 glycoside hydrolase family 16 protein [Hymenobacter sp. 5516J-16]